MFTDQTLISYKKYLMTSNKHNPEILRKAKSFITEKGERISEIFMAAFFAKNTNVVDGVGLVL
jgi:hypothetical protein